MGDTLIREQVKQVYPYKKWWIKIDKMRDDQVFALWTRLKKEGKI